MSRLFGTDGVRGIANYELTPKLAFDLGKAGAAVLSARGDKPVIVIGKDTRLSGDMLENALTAGVLAVGGNVIKVGILPTPAVAYLTRYYQADAGVVISASHNPFEYNGIKFFNGEGYKLADAIEEKIEDLIVREIDPNSHVTGEAIGICNTAEETAAELYGNFLVKSMDMRLDGYKICLDCANGAAYKVAPMVFRTLGAEIHVIGDDPNGININENIGSTHPEKLQKKVLETGADIGLAYDGDADRLIAVDEKGRIIDGDKTICICAKMLKDEGMLEGNLVTATVMSNVGFHKYVKEVIGAETVITDVGDRYVIESMLETGSVIGGEQSGHIIFRQLTTTGDGILSSLQFMKALIKSGRKASELSDEIEIFPQVLVNASIDNESKKTFMQNEEVKAEIERVKKIAEEDGGRLLIRPSGTELLARVMIEGRDIEKIRILAEDLASLISRKFANRD